MTASIPTLTPASQAVSVPRRPTSGRVGAILTAVAGIALGVVTLTGPSVPDQHWGTRGAVVNALGLVAFAAMALALQLVPDLFAPARVGRLGQRVAQTGLLLMVVESVASQINGGNTLGFLFMLGLLLSLVGLGLIAGDGLHRRCWLAPLPFLAMLFGVAAGDHGGFLVLGLAWAGLALLNPVTGEPAR